MTQHTQPITAESIFYKIFEPPDNLYVSTSSERIGSGFTRDIVSFLRDHRDIDLIIVDTLQKIRGSR